MKVRVNEKRPGVMLLDEIKSGILTEMMKGTLKQRLVLNAKKLRDYGEDARRNPVLLWMWTLSRMVLMCARRRETAEDSHCRIVKRSVHRTLRCNV